MGKSILRHKLWASLSRPKIAASIRRRLAVILLLTAAILTTLPSRLESSAPTREPIQIDAQLLSGVTSGHPPKRIIIPKLNIDLPVIEARVVNGYWELSETTASHGQGSAYPGESGNTVIFAHAREGLFLPLRDIQKDAIIYVLSATEWHRYKVVETKLVSPSQVEVIAPTSEERLTLFTCSGFMDSKRLIVVAVPNTAPL